MARSALTCHTQSVKDQTPQTLQANNACKDSLLTECTDGIRSHYPKHKNTPGCTTEVISDAPIVHVGNSSREDTYSNLITDPCESQSMTGKSSAMSPIANKSEFGFTLSEDVKLSTEYASDDTSFLSQEQMFKNQLIGSQTTTEAVPTYTDKVKDTGKSSVQIISPKQKFVKDSTIQNTKSNCYMENEARFKSFFNLPFEKFRTDIKHLCESGFYHDDKTTKIVCIICGYEVQENQTLEELNKDHIWKSPNCSEFVNTSKRHVECCEKIHREETDGKLTNTECSGSGFTHQPKASTGSVHKGNNIYTKMPDAEHSPISKFSGTTAQRGRFQGTPRPSKISGVARKVQKRSKTGVARPRNTTASCIGDQQSKNGASQSQQNQQIANDTAESKQFPNSCKRCIEDEFHLQKICDVRKKPKYAAFEKVQNQGKHVPSSVNCVSQEVLDAILVELGQPNACLTDDSMEVILILIGRYFPQYYIPYDMNKFFIENGVQALDTSLEFAQVIFVPPKPSEAPSFTKRNKEEEIGHFLLLTNIGCRKIFQVCDSLGERSTKLRGDSSHEIIRKCLGFEKAPIVVVEEKAVSGQIGDIYCGLFVIACLVDICLGNGDRLESFVYDQQLMRGHLIKTIKCLFQNRPIEEFPAINIDGDKRQSYVVWMRRE
ncbi:uncharacterized protein LOC110460655 isoform X2 [Mizuhopecten yessoensis]|uniref:uncharacterized protein LOC110460655 isoform X2 n=1 Tax=Mizuhopecten yessoensis TaxID=6573 RepID=UPI000B45AAE5|nr:uncharacterized protein LOC110460655 isoform X2 [Mizuhopecten yessoensis]